MFAATIALGLLAGFANAAPQVTTSVETVPVETEPVQSMTSSSTSMETMPVLPNSCYKQFAEGSTCFSYTTTVPPSSGCPTYTCQAQDPTLICPLYIVVTTTQVPCSTDCCPGTTPTATVTTSKCYECPNPHVCHIPTQTLTMTTGCPQGTQITTLLTWTAITGGPTGIPTDLPTIPGLL